MEICVLVFSQQLSLTLTETRTHSSGRLGTVRRPAALRWQTEPLVTVAITALQSDTECATSKKKQTFGLFSASVHHDEVGFAMSCKMGKYSACASETDAISGAFICFRMNSSLRTDELRHWVVFSLCPDGSRDAVILQDGQEELNKVWGVGRSDHIQHLGTEPDGFAAPVTHPAASRSSQLLFLGVSLPLWQSIGWGRCPCWASPDICECSRRRATRIHGSEGEPCGPAESSSAPSDGGREIQASVKRGGCWQRRGRGQKANLLHDVQLAVLRLKELDE